MTGPLLIIESSPVQRLLGFVIEISRSDGCARCRLDIREDHINRNGVVHGGILSTMLDCAGGFTAGLGAEDTDVTPSLTVSLNVQFLAPATSGHLVATGKRRGGGRKLLFVDIDLEHEDGTLIATAQGVFRRARTEGKHTGPGKRDATFTEAGAQQ